MTKPRKYQYQIQYVDNTYRIAEWTKKEFEDIGQAMQAEFNTIVLEDGIFRLTDIRAIAFIPEPEPLEEAAEDENQLSEWGFVDAETAAWLRAQGIDLGGGKA